MLASAIAGGLVAMVVVLGAAFAIGRKRRRGKDDDDDEDVGRPMSTLVEDDDVENFLGGSHENAHGVDSHFGLLYGPAGGGAADVVFAADGDVFGNDDDYPARGDDIPEAARGEVGGDGIIDEDDLAFDRLMANASRIKPVRKKTKFATTTPRHKAADSSNGGSGAIPQLHCAALAAREANDASLDDDFGHDAINDVDSATKVVPLGSRDSLHRTGDVAISGEIRNLNLLNRIVHDDERNHAKKLVYDDIDEAINLANTTRRDGSEDVDVVNTIEDMIRHAAMAPRGDETEAATADSEEISGIANATPARLNPFNMKDMDRQTQASHDILNDIKAAAEMRESSLLSQKEKYLEKQLYYSSQVPTTELSESSINVGQVAGSITPKEPEEESYDILDAINEVAKSKRSSIADANISGSMLTSRLNVLPPSILRNTNRCTTPIPVSPDPPGKGRPGDKTPNVLVEDESTMMSDVFFNLESVGMVMMKDDIGSSLPDSTNYSEPTEAGGCGSSIYRFTREILSDRLVGRKQDPPEGVIRPSSPPSVKEFSYVNPDTTTIISDDEDDDEKAISRPWKGKWDADQNANKKRGSSSREISRGSTDGSNYDPDSDWDVDDTEMEYVLPLEDVFEARSPSMNKAKDKPPVRIW
jgi:hypothetical protein